MPIPYPLKFPFIAAWAVGNRMGLLADAKVGSHPNLDANTLARWRSRVAEGGVYLEYGSGGSTIEALQHASAVFTVETDRRYLQAVEQKVATTFTDHAPFYPVHVDIGLTELWGRPLFRWHSKRALRRWQKYTSAPWEVLATTNMVPNFILIDGRFRIASVLESFLRLPDEADCLFLFDDFKGREQRYNVVLDFASDAENVGRALFFRRAKGFSPKACAAILRRYQADPE